MADVDENQKFGQFSEKSKELIRSMGNTEYFEMCEITLKVQWQDCLLYWEIGIVYCTCGTCLRHSQKNRKLNKDRLDVLSLPNYVIKKRARHGPTERQRIYLKDHTQDGKETRSQNHIGQIPQQPALSRLTNQYRVGWKYLCCLWRDRVRGPFSHCDKMGTKQKRKLVEVRAELWGCECARGSTR